MTRRLRIAHLIITPVLTWDDGDELTAGPPLNSIQLPLSRVFELVDSLPKEVAALAERLGYEASAADSGGDGG